MTGDGKFKVLNKSYKIDPYPSEDNMYDHGAILKEINRMPLSVAEKEKILGRNFAAIIGKLSIISNPLVINLS